MGSTKKGNPVPINLGLAHFPPLNTQEKKGHPQAIKVWTKEELIDIVSKLEAPQPPQELPKDCIAIVSSPNTTLEVIHPLPKVETLDAQRSIKGPDYKAVALKSAAANPSSSSKPPKQEQKKPAKVNSPRADAPASADGSSASNDHHQKKSSKGEKQSEKKKGPSSHGGKKNSPAPSHPDGEPHAPAAAAAVAPVKEGAVKEGVAESPAASSSSEVSSSEADKISWARLVSKPSDSQSHSHEVSSEAH